MTHVSQMYRGNTHFLLWHSQTTQRHMSHLTSPSKVARKENIAKKTFSTQVLQEKRRKSWCDISMGKFLKCVYFIIRNDRCDIFGSPEHQEVFESQIPKKVSRFYKNKIWCDNPMEENDGVTLW